jgi:hypothetical protein
MPTSRPSSRVHSVVLVLTCVGIFVAGLIAGSRGGDLTSSASAAPSRDIDMYSAFVSRVRAGERYHAAVASELRQRHYPTVPVFNWRTPLLYSVLARVPDRAARIALILLTVLLLAATSRVLAGRPPALLILGMLLQVGAAVAFLVPEAVVMTEAWAGVLVGLSMCAYLRSQARLGAALGVSALFVRELVAPYAVLCSLLALKHRRMNELAIWGLGATAYAVYYGWHVVQVSNLYQPEDFAHRSSWLYGGGLPFILNTLRMNAWILVSPPWAAAALLAVIVAACCADSTNVQLRGALVVFLGFFFVAGQPFNYYWGLIAAPVWPLALPDGVSALQNAVLVTIGYRNASTQPTR